MKTSNRLLAALAVVASMLLVVPATTKANHFDNVGRVRFGVGRPYYGRLYGHSYRPYYQRSYRLYSPRYYRPYYQPYYRPLYRSYYYGSPGIYFYWP